MTNAKTTTPAATTATKATAADNAKQRKQRTAATRTTKAPAKEAAAPRKTPAKVKATATKAQRAAGTITTVDIATEQGVSAKTLRARIRRNIDDWAPLFKAGEKHVFADNKTTRNKIMALLS